MPEETIVGPLPDQGFSVKDIDSAFREMVEVLPGVGVNTDRRCGEPVSCPSNRRVSVKGESKSIRLAVEGRRQITGVGWWKKGGNSRHRLSSE